jgi:predicted DCC family thiol-disulfide oxidoreductase YuxK
METKVSTPKRITTVYYDGTCPMCTAFVGATAAKDDTQFTLRDATVDTLPESFTKEAVLREMHVVDGDGVVYTNAEAILRILDTVPYWRRMTWIGRFPVVRTMLPVGYGIIARNRHFLFGPVSRVFWVKITVVLGLLASMLLSIPLWVQTDGIASVPVFSRLPILSPLIEWCMYLGVFTLALVSLISPKPQRYLFGILGIISIFVLFDQLRLQPWLYQYWFMLLPLALFSWQWRDSVSVSAVLNTLRILIAGIYFYSGLQKVTLPFFEDYFPWIVEPLGNLLPTTLHFVPASFGLFVPFIEMFMGVGLLFLRTRQAALIGVVCMLLFVLVMLGPLGNNWNSVVWPWNIAIAASAWLLFYKTPTVSFKNIFGVKKFLAHKLIILVFIVMPAFSFFGYWDSYPSYSLYSGNTTGGGVYVSSDLVNPTLEKVAYNAYEGVAWIDLQTLSFEERNVPMYPEVRIYTKVFTQLCRTELPASAELVVTTKSTLLEPRKVLRYRCDKEK